MRSIALLKRAVSAALTAAICITALALYSCSGYDPNVKEDESITAAQSEGLVDPVTPNQDDAPVDEGYVYIGGGRDQVRNLNGVSVDVGAFARRSYELCYLLGQTSFSSPSEIALDSVVLYAFCHLYYDELWMMPRGGNTFYTASPDDVAAKITEFFGKTDFEVRLSNYYASGTDKLEMFAPNQYGTNLYYNVESAEFSADGENFMIYTAFYKDSEKTSLIGRTVLGLKVADGAATIASITSEY